MPKSKVSSPVKRKTPTKSKLDFLFSRFLGVFGIRKMQEIEMGMASRAMSQKIQLHEAYSTRIAPMIVPITS